MTQSTRTVHRVLSMDGTGYDMAPDGTPIRTLTRTPTGGSLATCPRTLATAGTIRERLDRLARNNRDASAKLATLRADNARLAALVAAARKSTRTTIRPRISTAAATKSAAVLTVPYPRLVCKHGDIFEEND